MSDPAEKYSDDALDHNTGVHHLIETGDENEVAMILGHKDRLRCGGVIRTGVKVPKASCSPEIKKRFAELEAQGLGYDDIDRQLGGEPKSAKSLLVPRNADFFVVRDCDFTRPVDAQTIRQRHADPDGKVRRIPVWFPLGEIDRVIPHGFRAFNGSGALIAASFYEGKNLMVRFTDAGFKGAPKRDDFKVAPFDPEKMVNAKGDPVTPSGIKLDFGGFYKFNVPGLRGFDEIVVPTRSWYGMSYSVALLRRVRQILGRFDGLLNGEPFFELVKSPEEVKTPDGKRQTQFIPVLELAVDPMELARYAEPMAVAARAAKARRALVGSAPHLASIPGADPVAEGLIPEKPPVSEAFSAAQTPVGRPAAPAPAEQPALPLSSDPPPADDAPFGDEDPARVRANEYLHGAAKFLGVTWEQFATWVVLEETGGEQIEDLSLDDLRALANKVKGLMRADKAKLSAEVTKVAAAHGVN